MKIKEMILNDIDFMNLYYDCLIERLKDYYFFERNGKILNNVHEKTSDDFINSFNYMINNLNNDLSIDFIKNLGFKISESNQYVYKDFRTSGEFITDTNIKVPEAKHVKTLIRDLINVYEESLNEHDLFLCEAALHINIVLMQPFEDGNHRLAALVTIFNMLKNGYAPIIINSDIINDYMEYIKNRDVVKLALVFKNLSKEENNFINDFYTKNHQISK